MKYLKKFNESLSTSELQQIKDTFFYYCPNVHEGNFTINPENGSIDISDYIAVIINQKNKSEHSKLPIKFGSVPWQFFILNCPITTLEGCPHTTQYFKVEKTRITDLTGGPTSVIRYELEGNSRLTSLKGLGHEIGGLEILNCPIRSLEGCPTIMEGDFIIEGTKLKNLIGGPKEVGGQFCIEDSSITSLEGIPNKVQLLRLECPYAWDPTPLRNTVVESEVTMSGPISFLVSFFFMIFGGNDSHDETFGNPECWDKFRDSLDYNYVRQRDNKWEIIHFKFMEALSELDITTEDLGPRYLQKTSLGPYKFVDEEGDYVNLLGEKLSQG